MTNVFPGTVLIGRRIFPVPSHYPRFVGIEEGKVRRSPVFYTRSKISRISRPPLFHLETNDDINLIVAVVRNAESDFIVKIYE